MLTAQSVCRACRSKLLAATVDAASSRALSTNTSRTRLHKRARLSVPAQQSAQQRGFSRTALRRQQQGPEATTDGGEAHEYEQARPREHDDSTNGNNNRSEGAQEQEEPPRKRTPREVEAAAREAKHRFGDVLPLDHLTGEEYVVYERLFGAPVRMAPVEELFPEEEEEEGEYEEEVVSVRESLYIQCADGSLKEVEYFRGVSEDAEEGQGRRGAEEVLQEEDEAELEELDEGIEEMELVDEDNAYMSSGGEQARAHPLTIAGRFATSPTTVYLPKAGFVDPISDIISAASKKHLTDVAQRVFGGHRLPHSTATPRSPGGLEQKPIPLEPGQSSMTAMEGDSYMAAVMPGTYASVMSAIVEVRKRLGTEWIEGLLRKDGGPLILDVSSGGAAVVAWREVLKAEWERMQETSPATSGQLASPPLGKASVITGSDTFRRRAAQFLENTTFLPRLPDAILPDEKVGPKARKVYDIIVAPHFLWSLNEEYLRKAAVQKLWSLLNPRGGVLILLEKGLPRGFEVIAGARALLLDNMIASPGSTHLETPLQDSRNAGRWTKKEEGMIVAPCTNHAGCPMYLTPGVSRNRKDFCYFKQRYIRPPYLQRLLGARDRNHEDVQFSYLAVRRGGDLRRDAEGWTGFEQGEKTTDRAFAGYDIELEGEGETEAETVMKADGETVAAEQEQAQTQTSSSLEEASEAQQQPSSTSPTAEASSAAAPTTTPPPPPSDRPHNALTLMMPRLMLPPLKRHGHIILDVCTPAGRLERWTVPKSYSKQAYRDARKAQWGDLWALGAATRVARMVRVGSGKEDLPAWAGRGWARSASEGKDGKEKKMSKEMKRRLKDKRGKTEKKGKVTRREEREWRVKEREARGENGEEDDDI